MAKGLKQWEGARDVYRQACDIYRHIEDNLGLSNALAEMVEIFALTGKRNEALKLGLSI